MAKRRKVEEEGKLFEEPEFDVRQFLVDEMTKAKGIIIVFLLAIGVGLASAYLQVYFDAFSAVALGLLFLLLLRNILKFARAEFAQRNTWIFAILAFIILWLSFWTVGLNPPFNDVSPPQVRVVQVYNGSAWVEVYNYTSSYTPGVKERIEKNLKDLDWNSVSAVRVVVTDNVAVSRVLINGAEAKHEGKYYVVSVDDMNANVPPVQIRAYDTGEHSTTITVPTGM